MIRYVDGKYIINAQTPIDRLAICWCVDMSGKGSFYKTERLKLNEWTP